MAPEQTIKYNRHNQKWIVSKKDDLIWITGSSVVSLFLLSMYFFLTQTLPWLSGIEVSAALVVAIIFLVWTLIFDSTHFFATYSRTFLDAQYHPENKVMLYSSLVIFFLGPVFLITPLLLVDAQNQKAYTYAMFALIIFGSLLWGYFHLIRQHWGFIALYQKKNKEDSKVQYKLDAILLFVGSLWPFLFYLNNELLAQPLMLAILEVFQAREFANYLFYLAGLSFLAGALFNLSSQTKALGKLFFVIGAILLSLVLVFFIDLSISIESSLILLELFFRYLFLATIILYLGYYLFVNKNWNIPKFLLMGSVLFTHNIVLLSVSDFLLISACLTIFHNIQYHRIVRYFNVNHYHKGMAGMAVKLTDKLGHFVFVALVFSVLVFFLRGSTTLVESGLLQMILITSVINGISLHHYFLDGLIWKTSKDLSLSASLKL